MTRDRAMAVVWDSVDELNEELDSPLAKSDDTQLFGTGESKLDSIDLINLIANVEERACDTFELEITLADERAMEADESPFRTLGTLIDYLALLLEEAAAAS